MQEEIKKKNCKAIIVNSNCDFFLQETKERFDLIFLDPPFNQKKEYAMWNDDMDDVSYWNFMRNVCEKCFLNSKEGGTIYFMQREKNVENVLKILRETGWTFQNLIIWKKLTSAAPLKERYSKQYQIIVFASKGKKIKTFNKLRINPPLPPHYKSDREKGIYLTDVWDDIRELTSGYFAGKEAFRGENGERFHKQQSPIALLLRIILSSTLPGDMILDPFAGTGTTGVVAAQLDRNSISVEIDPKNCDLIKERIKVIRDADDVKKFKEYYKYTENLEKIWKKSNDQMEKDDA